MDHDRWLEKTYPISRSLLGLPDGTTDVVDGDVAIVGEGHVVVESGKERSRSQRESTHAIQRTRAHNEEIQREAGRAVLLFAPT